MYDIEPFLGAHNDPERFLVDSCIYFPRQKANGSWFLSSREVHFRDGIRKILQDNPDGVGIRYSITDVVDQKIIHFPNTLHIIPPDHSIRLAATIDMEERYSYFLMTTNWRDWHIPKSSYMLKTARSPHLIYLRDFEGLVCGETGMPIGHVVETPAGEFEIKEIDLPPSLCAVQPTKLNIVMPPQDDQPAPERSGFKTINMLRGLVKRCALGVT